MSWACGCCSLLRLWWREVWAPWPETPALSQRPRQRWPTPCGRPWTTWRAWLRAFSASAQPAAALGGRDVPSPSLQLLLLPHRPHRKQPSLSRRWGGRNAPSPRSPSPPPPHPHRPTTPMFRGRLHVVILRLFLFFLHLQVAPARLTSTKLIGRCDNVRVPARLEAWGGPAEASYVV